MPYQGCFCCEDWLDGDDLLVVGAGDGDSGGEFEIYRDVHSGYHCVCVGVCHGDDKVGELRGCIFTEV